MDLFVRPTRYKRTSKSASGHHIIENLSKANFFKKSARTLAVLLFVGEMGFILIPASSKAQPSPSDNLSSDTLSSQPASITAGQSSSTTSSSANVNNSSSSNTSSTNITVNGQPVSVPANGSIQHNK